MKTFGLLGFLFAIGIAEGFALTTQFLVFIALAVVGLIALGISAFFGGDHDVHADHDVHVGHGDTGDHGSAPSFFSPRIFFAFLVGFGATGAGATAYGKGALLSSVIGIVPGALTMVAAYFIVRMFYKQQANSGIKIGEVLGKTGTVVTFIPQSGLGEINVNVAGQIVQYTAVSQSGAAIPAGKIVKVVQDLGDRLVVSPA